MLKLNKEKAIIGGVCAGLADSTEISVGIIRFAFIASVLLFGIGLLPYLVLWIFMCLNGKKE